MKFKTDKLKYTFIKESDIIKKSNEFYQNIKERRSVREFSNHTIDINIINNAILAAGTAPSGANLQPWHFVVIKDKKD